jgi:simple sugar transport system permease protein
VNKIADLTTVILFLSFALQQAVTISVAAQGELLTEKSGILNIGIEGTMLMSAFSAAAFDAIYEPQVGALSAVLGLVAGMATGVTVSFVFSFMSTKLNVDQVIAGIGVNLFALGITYVILAKRFTIDGTPIANTLPPLLVIRGLAATTSISISPMDVVMFVLPVLTYFLLFKTKFGLHVRAVGENPKAAEVAGVSVVRTRILATSLGGALLGASGAYLTIDLFNQFTPGITGGVGFIAIAAVIAGAWRPGYVLGVAIVFGSSLGLINVVQATGGPEFYLLTMLPYLITVVALSLASKRLRPPAALALPYKKE